MKFRILSSRIGQVGETITLDELMAKGADLASLIGGGFIDPINSDKKPAQSATIKKKQSKE
jgi:hypothetical protein